MLDNTLPALTPRTESLMPFLTMLSSDVHSIMIPRPANYIEPPRYQKLEHVCMDKFHGLLAEVNADNSHCSILRTNSERMTQLLDISMMAFKNAEKDKARRKNMSNKKRRWYDAFTRWIVKKNVEEVRAVLESSAAFRELREQQKERKRAAEVKAVGRSSSLPSIFETRRGSV